MRSIIGQVFTPILWAKWLIQKWQVFDAWVDGARICDPTAGRGAFALAMFEIAKDRGVDITPALLSRLKLIDSAASNLAEFKNIAKLKFGINFPTSNLICTDVIINPITDQFDVLIGNPPWQNFADLPHLYKAMIKSIFIKEGLVTDKRNLLLGSSRIDLAALALKVTLGRLLAENGSGYFYVPLSLFCGDDAHAGFRNYRANGRDFNVAEVHEFSHTKVFNGISTAYCAAQFQIDKHQEFPVTYFKESATGWKAYQAMPLLGAGSQWRIIQREIISRNFEPFSLPPNQKPRQGINTCGANGVFIFAEKPSQLPSDLLFPVASKETWRSDENEPMKWILVPHDTGTSKPLAWSQIAKYEGLSEYLLSKRSILETRKGTLIQSAIQSGKWWSLFGVGIYSFAPYKVMWESYGRDQFTPIILGNFNGQPWQGNQALHAYIPCWNRSEAERIQAKLAQPEISLLLEQTNGGGRCNWAQPGKVMKVIAAASGVGNALS